MSHRKILFLIPTCVDPGGAQKLVDSISQLLISEHSVSIASFDPPGSIRYFNSNIPFFPIGFSIELITPFRQLSYLWLAIKLRALKRTLGIEMTVSVLWQADLVNSFTMTKDKRISLAVINILNNKTNAKMIKMRSFVGLIYRRLDEILAISPNILNEYMDIYGVVKQKISVFKNFLPKPDPIPIFEDNIKRFMVCGRFVFEKNIEGLLYVWSAYLQRNPGSQLVIIGDGPLLLAMKALANSLRLSVGVDPKDLSADVLFIGSSTRPEDYIVGAYAFLITSRHEGLPTVAIMAASLGLPIIGSDCDGGGLRYLFNIPDDTQLSDANNFDTEILGVILPIPDNSDPNTISTWVNTLELIDSDPIIHEKLLLGAEKIATNHSVMVARKYWLSLIERSFPS